MKNLYKNVCWLFATLLMLVSCEAVDLTELHSSDSSQGSKSANAQILRVNATATEGSISYPVTVYAFAADGSYVASQAIETASGSLSLKLAPGSYRIVAFAGTDDLTIEEVEGIGSKIDVPSQSTTALQMGTANVTVASTPVNAYINMGYMVSGVRFTLSDVPEDATAVSVTVSNVATEMDFSGEPKGSSAVTIPLDETFELGGWKSSEVFVMPSTATSTVLTISITRPDNTETYSYTHPSALIAGTPYHFRGKYMASSGGGESGDSKISLSGDFIAATWNDTEIVDFNFGDYKKPTIVESGYIPPYSIWNGHVVALVDSIDEHTEDLLLYSLAEWSDVPPYSVNPIMADSIAKSYIEGDLAEWTIPTKEQAKALRNAYNINGNNPSLGLLLEEAGSNAVGYWKKTEDNGINVRYLCENGNNRYNFNPSSNVDKTYASQLYLLRLVKVVRHEY